MIAKTAVIRMFLYRHYLYGIVSCRCNTGQNIIFELRISAYLFGILRHTNMTFVYEKRVFLRRKSRLSTMVFRCRYLIIPLVFFCRRPDLSRENLRHFILNNTCCPRRNALATASFPLHVHLIKVSVGNSFRR